MVDIRQVVQLKQAMRRWANLSLRRNHRRSHAADGDDPPSASRPVPPGFLAVYVGQERRRFVIPTRFLYYPVFASLLRQAEEEFGFSAAGALALPCDAEFFRRVLQLLDVDECRYRLVGLEGFLQLEGRDLCACRDEMDAAERCDELFSPLLEKARI